MWMKSMDSKASGRINTHCYGWDAIVYTVLSSLLPLQPSFWIKSYFKFDNNFLNRAESNCVGCSVHLSAVDPYIFYFITLEESGSKK